MGRADDDRSVQRVFTSEQERDRNTRLFGGNWSIGLVVGWGGWASSVDTSEAGSWAHTDFSTSRSRAKAFSVLAGGGFAGFGERSVMEPPVRLKGEAQDRDRIGVFIGPDSWFQALWPDSETRDRDRRRDALCRALRALGHVDRLGRSVLLARNVYIADHRPLRRHGPPDIDQGTERVGPGQDR